MTNDVIRNNMKINQKEKDLINSILEKLAKEKDRKKDKIVLVDFKDIYENLSKEEIELCKKFLKINPRKYGFKGKFLGIKPVPKNLVVIKNQKYKEKDKIEKIVTQYLSNKVYKRYLELNKALYKDSGKKLLIDSCYRSPAYQLIIFIYYLRFHKWNLKKVAGRVALPGYSEHGDNTNPAIDFITTDGKPSDENPLNFLDTEEYKWLKKNAKNFGFYLSYPKNNKLGVIFEPWHWRLK